MMVNTRCWRECFDARQHILRIFTYIELFIILMKSFQAIFLCMFFCSLSFLFGCIQIHLPFFFVMGCFCCFSYHFASSNYYILLDNNSFVGMSLDFYMHFFHTLSLFFHVRPDCRHILFVLFRSCACTSVFTLLFKIKRPNSYAIYWGCMHIVTHTHTRAR